jgi:SAM-dependent methyltransferase
MVREALGHKLVRFVRTPVVALRRVPSLQAGGPAWRRFFTESGRYTATGVSFSSPSAHRYCVGHGLEIGGSAHNPFDLDSRNVDTTNSLDTIYKQHEIAVCGRALPVDIVSPDGTLPVPDESQDFVVSSHVLEHFPNPIGAMVEWNRVLKPGGVIFMIVPHKERTFDREFPRTPLEHLIHDYETKTQSPHENPLGGHDHIWITEDIVEMVEWMRAELQMPWEIVEVQDVDDKVGNGFTIVIRKYAD